MELIDQSGVASVRAGSVVDAGLSFSFPTSSHCEGMIWKVVACCCPLL